MTWQALSDKVLSGQKVSRDEARAILNSTDDELLDLLQAAFRIRSMFHGRGVRIHVLQNAKKGMCRENCKFCSQAMGAYAGVERYKM